MLSSYGPAYRRVAPTSTLGKRYRSILLAQRWGAAGYSCQKAVQCTARALSHTAAAVSAGSLPRRAPCERRQATAAAGGALSAIARGCVCVCVGGGGGGGGGRAAW